MKKLFLFMATVLMGSFAITDAQVKKTWDFSQGLSEKDRTNLIADATNWTTNGEGDAAYWNDKVKLSGTIKANGEPLEFLEHLTVGTNGLSSSNNFKLGPAAYRMSRKGMRTYLPKLANGQKITVMARSANGDATDRGLIGNSNMTYVSGPTNGICLGNKVEGSEGTYTLIWEVKTEGTDSVDCCIEIVGGGVDIQSIIIDNGDEEVAPEALKVAYLYDATYNGATDADKNPIGFAANGGLETDPIYSSLNDNFEITAIDFNAWTLSSAELNDSLINFDAVVLSEAVSSGNALAKGMVEIINKVPMVNFKSFMYKSGVWSMGAGANPKPAATSVVFNEDLIESELVQALLNEIEMESTELKIFENGEIVAGNLVQGYTTAEGSLFENDEVLATVGEGINAIHAHGGKRNLYLLLPFSSDNLCPGGEYNLTDEAMTLVANAVRAVAATKSKVSPAATPAIAQFYQDGVTRVAVSSATKGSTIYYTLDGSDPTTTSSVYTDTLEVSVDGTIVKAIAVAQGYEVSAVATATVLVKSQAAVPGFSVELAEGRSIVTLTPAAGTNAYFSFNLVTTVPGAQLYNEEKGIVLTEPATLTYFASSDSKIQSEVTTTYIAVKGIPAVKDTVAHFTSNEEDWFSNAVLKNSALEDQELPTSNWAAKAAYYWGKSAWAYYGTEVDHTEPVLDAEGNPLKCEDGVTDSVKVVYKANPESVKYVYSTTDTQWRLRSQGQVLTGECNVAASYTVGGENLVGYYAQSAYDLIGEPSKGKLTFGGKGSGEPYSAGVESTVKFQAPFDVVTYTTNGGGSAYVLVLQTSTDGETWNTVDTLSCADTQRYYVKDRMHVDSADELYVRVAHVAGSTKAQLYDIYVITTEGITDAIETVKSDAAVVATRIFDLQGREVRGMVRGQLYIQNGKKVVVK